MKTVILDASTLGNDIDLSVFNEFGKTEIFQKTEPSEVESRISDADFVIINKKVGLLLLKLADIKETERAENVPEAKRNKLSSLYRSFRVEVRNSNSYEQAQVSAGGVDCREVTSRMESKLIRGLYFGKLKTFYVKKICLRFLIDG